MVIPSPLVESPAHERTDRRNAEARARRAASPEEGDELRTLVQRFIRAFGLLSSDRTPCGKPLSVSHAQALMILLEHRRDRLKPTQQQLGKELGIDKSNVARLCARMQKAGHITQERCLEDGRARRLSLTDTGARVATNVEKSSRQRFASVLSAIPPHARAGVLSALEALNDAVRESSPRGATRIDPAAAGEDSR
jgi:DNA-binding MarR family transcriptional regulator